MKTNKSLIIQLIKQDLRHTQLIRGLHRLGFETDIHTLEIMEAIAGMMGLEPKDITEQWCNVYMNCLRRAGYYPVTGLGNELLPLAEECYTALVALMGDT